jgi:Family of unknown function (DUF5985)
MEEFIRGATTMASLVAAMIFLRFWRRTRDRLFFIFGTVFVLLGMTRFGLVLLHERTESDTNWYWVRLVAFVLILIAILDKNRRQP